MDDRTDITLDEIFLTNVRRTKATIMRHNKSRIVSTMEKIDFTQDQITQLAKQAEILEAELASYREFEKSVEETWTNFGLPQPEAQDENQINPAPRATGTVPNAEEKPIDLDDLT